MTAAGLVLVLGAVLAGIWWLLATAPTVNPGNCDLADVREGRRECGGPCRSGSKQPCED